MVAYLSKNGINLITNLPDNIYTGFSAGFTEFNRAHLHASLKDNRRAHVSHYWRYI